MSSLVSVLYKQNLYLLLTAVSFGVCGERNICPGIQKKIRGQIAGEKKKKGILVKEKESVLLSAWSNSYSSSVSVI